MVTCKVDAVSVPKMNSMRGPKPASSNSSGFRLLDGDHLETSSSVSRNSVYKLKIDLMFDDSRSVRSNRLDDPRGSHRTRSIIMYGRSELASTGGDSSRSLASFLQETNEASSKLVPNSNTKKDVQRISNSVQAQIEQLFTDVAKDATSTFAVTCLGSLPLKDKVTSLQGLQEPLKELYLKEVAKGQRNCGSLDICATGLRVKMNMNGDNDDEDDDDDDDDDNNENTNYNNSNHSNNNNIENSCDGKITPFHNIAVWSAVKFVISEEDGTAAFLPLITDPDNIDKTSLFQPLSSKEQEHLAKSKTHAPIFAVVMRSAGVPKTLECHGFICKNTEDAIVIAATLYQSLMAHVSSSSHRSTKRRTPRNQNGVSCVSIASSSAMTGSNYLSRSQIVSNGRKSSMRSSSGHSNSNGGNGGSGGNENGNPSRPGGRKKRVSSSSLSSSNNVINEAAETTTEERKRKSHKTKRAPPIPLMASNLLAQPIPNSISSKSCNDIYEVALSGRNSQRGGFPKKSTENGYRTSNGGFIGNGGNLVVPAGVPMNSQWPNGGNQRSNDMNGDILTRVAIPRSGSFLNTGGLTRYKSRAARRHSDKLGGGGGGGGGSPLGFSELFNEFRLHENLNSLDEILYAIIDADGMSFNDLKPIYKEFLLKLAVTLTKDELFQRSKNIMRRQKKKKMKRKANGSINQKKPRTLLFGAKSLKKVFQLGQFRACRGKPSKAPRTKGLESHRKSSTPPTIGPPTNATTQPQRSQRSQRIATSGSDVSVIRNDAGAFNGPHRNSSSGYVSCSECSYDSEACTCISADRCYCSLRPERNASQKVRRKNERNLAASNGKKIHAPGSRSRSESNFNSNSNTNTKANRSSYISCKSDDKCYCSMVEEEPPNANDQGGGIAEDPDDSTSQSHSDTTWCDTDSCVSASKCYCKRTERRSSLQHQHQHQQHQQPRQTQMKSKHNGRLLNERHSNAAAAAAAALVNVTSDSDHSRHSQSRTSRMLGRKPSDKLALDYELFTIGGNGKSVQPHEALSMKKSVEAAAIFADVKLSQTTDIKTLCPPSLPMNGGHLANISEKLAILNNIKNRGSCRSYSASSSSSKKFAGHAFSKRRDSYSVDRKNERNALVAATLSSSSSHKSCSADDLLSKLSAIEKAASVKSSSISSSTRHHRRIYASSKEHFQASSTYQSMRAVSASLEDTLGYLP